MKKHLILWSLIIGLGLMFIFIIVAVKFSTEISITNQNFPLRERWVSSLNGNIEGISAINEKVILVRTTKVLYAIETNTGSLLWQHKLAWQAIPEPAISSDGVVLVADGEMIWALDQRDGSLRWKQPVPRPDAQVRAAATNLVAVEIEQDLNVYNIANGSLAWNKPVCRNDIQAYFYDTNVYIPCYGIRAIDANSGKDVWEMKESEKIAKVAYDKGVMYFSPDQLLVVAFDLQKRVKVWEVSIKNEGYTQFKIIEDILFLTDSYQFCAIQKVDGHLLWCTENKNPQNPALLGNIAYIFDGKQKEITALDIANGREIGRLTTTKISFATVYKQLMISTDELLIFGIGNEVFAFE